MTRLYKDKRCFKCIKPGYRSTDPDIPCKDLSPLTKDQVTAILKAVGVEWEEKTPDESEN